MEISFYSLLLRIKFSFAGAAGRQEQHRYIIPVPELQTRVPALPGGGQDRLLSHHASAGSRQGIFWNGQGYILERPRGYNLEWTGGSRQIWKESSFLARKKFVSELSCKEDCKTRNWIRIPFVAKFSSSKLLTRSLKVPEDNREVLNDIFSLIIINQKFMQMIIL